MIKLELKFCFVGLAASNGVMKENRRSRASNRLTDLIRLYLSLLLNIMELAFVLTDLKLLMSISFLAQSTFSNFKFSFSIKLFLLIYN